VPRALGSVDRGSIWSPRTDLIFCALAKMHSPETDALGLTPLYFTNNGQDIAHSGETWRSWFVTIEEPKQGDGFVEPASLTISTVSMGAEVVQAIRSTPTDLLIDWCVVRLAVTKPLEAGKLASRSGPFVLFPASFTLAQKALAPGDTFWYESHGEVNAKAIASIDLGNNTVTLASTPTGAPTTGPWRIRRVSVPAPTVGAVIVGWRSSRWRDVELDGSFHASGSLQTEERWNDEPFPWPSYTPQSFPGLF